MEINQRQRWVILLGALALTGIVSFYGDGGELSARVEEKAAAPKVRHPEQEAAAASSNKIDVALATIPEKLESRVTEDAIENVFVPKSWAPPPPPPPKPMAQPKVQAPPPKPMAPPLPYKYLGRLEEDGVVIVYLGAGERNYAVKPGDQLDGNYRLDAVQGAVLTFTYLPLQQQQSLTIGQPN